MTKVIVIGGGPGGYVAAIRAAQLGGEVTLIEKNRIGGTCLNVGCIPTKALLHAAELFDQTRCETAAYGIETAVTGLDWDKLQQTKNAIIDQLVAGVTGLMKVNRITVVAGEARFHARDTVTVQKDDGTTENITGDRIIIASGSIPATVPIPGIESNAACVDSSGALSLEAVPKSMVVIGGGVIGVELATAYNAFGTDVTIVEALPGLLPLMDREMTSFLQESMEARGISILTSARVQSVEALPDGARVHIEADGKALTLDAEKLLMAVGRRTNTASLGLDAVGIAHDRGRIVVNEKMETNLDGVYAIGDCLGQIMLAHIASAQGEIAAENAMGHPAVFASKTNPSCVYTTPEFAGVGLTEDEAKAQGIAYTVGRFPLAANAKSLITNGGQGTVKLLFGATYGELLGAHILGPRATDIIGELALAIGLEATVDELISTIHAHPTVSEVVREAALASQSRAIHIPN